MKVLAYKWPESAPLPSARPLFLIESWCNPKISILMASYRHVVKASTCEYPQQTICLASKIIGTIIVVCTLNAFLGCVPSDDGGVGSSIDSSVGSSSIGHAGSLRSLHWLVDPCREPSSQPLVQWQHRNGNIQWNCYLHATQVLHFSFKTDDVGNWELGFCWWMKCTPCVKYATKQLL